MIGRWINWQQGAGRIWAPDAVFTDIMDEANQGVDIELDLAGAAFTAQPLLIVQDGLGDDGGDVAAQAAHGLLGRRQLVLEVRLVC